MKDFKKYITFKKIKKNIAYAVSLFFTFYIAYFLGNTGYLYPYFDSDLTAAFVLLFLCYYIFGFLITIIVTDSARVTLRFINIALFGGVVLFFMYLIPYSGNFKNNTSDVAYSNLFKKMGLSKDINDEKYKNTLIDEIYESYKKRDISKLVEYENKINDVKTISKKEFSQFIVNVKVINNPVITDFYNKILADKRISINEYNKIVELIVSQELSK